MTLSGRLLHMDLTFNCPHCDLAIIKPGSWFQSIRQFNCQGCKREVRITYVHKVALFEKHAHLGRFKRS
jgi:hypothetical protein